MDAWVLSSEVFFFFKLVLSVAWKSEFLKAPDNHIVRPTSAESLLLGLPANGRFRRPALALLDLTATDTPAM